MLVIGLTGGIASGKSTTGDRFAERGAAVIDADQIARDVVAAGTPGLAAVVEAFGADILTPDGTMDRARMRKRVFADPQALKTLESILHPLIGAGLKQAVEDCAGQPGTPYCVLMIPLLVERGLGRQLIDRIAVVDLEPEQQLQRIMQRDGGSGEDAQRILNAQASREERLAAADDVIANHADLDALYQQVDQLHGRYLELADGLSG